MEEGRKILVLPFFVIERSEPNLLFPDPPFTALLDRAFLSLRFPEEERGLGEVLVALAGFLVVEEGFTVPEDMELDRWAEVVSGRWLTFEGVVFEIDCFLPLSDFAQILQ